ARVVERDVQPAVAFHGGRHEPGHVLRAGHVGGHRVGPAALVLDQLHGLLQRAGAAAGDHHGGALTGEGERRGPAEAGPSAGDEGDPAGETCGHRLDSFGVVSRVRRGSAANRARAGGAAAAPLRARACPVGGWCECAAASDPSAARPTGGPISIAVFSSPPASPDRSSRASRITASVAAENVAPAPRGKTTSPAYGTSSRLSSSRPAAAVAVPAASTRRAPSRGTSRPASGPEARSAGTGSRKAADVRSGDRPRTCCRWSESRKNAVAIAPAQAATAIRGRTRPRRNGGGTSGAGTRCS